MRMDSLWELATSHVTYRSEERAGMCRQVLQQLLRLLEGHVGGCILAAPLEAVLGLLDEAALQRIEVLIVHALTSYT